MNKCIWLRFLGYWAILVLLIYAGLYHVDDVDYAGLDWERLSFFEEDRSFTPHELIELYDMLELHIRHSSMADYVIGIERQGWTIVVALDDWGMDIKRRFRSEFLDSRLISLMPSLGPMPMLTG